MRSRAKSLPCSAFFWWYLAAPPFSTRLRSSWSCFSVGMGGHSLPRRAATSEGDRACQAARPTHAALRSQSSRASGSLRASSLAVFSRCLS